MPDAEEDRGEAEGEADFEGEAEGAAEGGVDHGSVEDYGLALGGGLAGARSGWAWGERGVWCIRRGACWWGRGRRV